MDRKVVGVVLFGVIAVVISPTPAGCALVVLMKGVTCG